jgi:hypothetical protein
MDIVLNSIPDNLFIYYHAPNSFLIFLPPIISSKSSLLLLQEHPTQNVSFDRSSPNSYLALSSHIYYMFLFLFGLLIFAIKLKYTKSRVYRSYYRDDYITDQYISRRSNPEHFNRHGLCYLCLVHIFY